MAVPVDGAAIGLDQADDGVERGAFARAVGADEGDDLPGGHIKADAAQRVDAAVANRQVFDGEHGYSTPR